MECEYVTNENGAVEEIVIYTGLRDSDFWPIKIILKGEDLENIREILKIGIPARQEAEPNV